MNSPPDKGLRDSYVNSIRDLTGIEPSTNNDVVEDITRTFNTSLSINGNLKVGQIVAPSASGQLQEEYYLKEAARAVEPARAVESRSKNAVATESLTVFDRFAEKAEKKEKAIVGGSPERCENEAAKDTTPAPTCKTESGHNLKSGADEGVAEMVNEETGRNPVEGEKTQPLPTIRVLMYGEANFNHAVAFADFVHISYPTLRWEITATEIRTWEELLNEYTHKKGDIDRNVRYLGRKYPSRSQDPNQRVFVFPVFGIDATKDNSHLVRDNELFDIVTFHFVQSNNAVSENGRNTQSEDQAIVHNFFCTMVEENILKLSTGQIIMCTKEREGENTKYRGNHYKLSLHFDSNNMKFRFIPLDCHRYHPSQDSSHFFYSHVGTNATAKAELDNNNCVVWRMRRFNDVNDQHFRTLYRQLNNTWYLIGGLAHDAREFRSLSKDWEDEGGSTKGFSKAVQAYFNDPTITYKKADDLFHRFSIAQDATFQTKHLLILAWFWRKKYESEAKAFHAARGGLVA